MTLENVFNLIKAERMRQEALYGPQEDRTRLEWHAILAEEMGEVSKEINDIHFKNKDTEELLTELIQLASVAVAMVQLIEND